MTDDIQSLSFFVYSSLNLNAAANKTENSLIKPLNTSQITHRKIVNGFSEASLCSDECKRKSKRERKTKTERKRRKRNDWTPVFVSIDGEWASK